MAYPRYRSSLSPRRARRGFSLLEVLIVVAIIGVLSSMAVPQYRLAQFRSRAAEAYTILGMIKNAQYALFGSYDCFSNLRRTPELGYPPTNEKAAWVSTLNPTLPRCGGTLAMTDVDVRPAFSFVYHFYECRARSTPADYTCNALGDLDNDGVIAEYILCSDHTGSGAGCLASSTGEVSLFPFDVLRPSVGAF